MIVRKEGMTKNKLQASLAIAGFLVASVIALWVLNQPPSIGYIKAHPQAFHLGAPWSVAYAEEVLNSLFPVGTSKGDVDLFLVTQNNFIESEKEHWDNGVRKLGSGQGEYHVYYLQPGDDKKREWFIRIKFNHDDKVSYRIYARPIDETVQGMSVERMVIRYLINEKAKEKGND